jgi:hypothetical protein
MATLRPNFPALPSAMRSPRLQRFSPCSSFVEAQTELLFTHEDTIPQQPSFRGIGNRTFLCEPIRICFLKGIANIDLMESEYEQLPN